MKVARGLCGTLSGPRLFLPGPAMRKRAHDPTDKTLGMTWHEAEVFYAELDGCQMAERFGPSVLKCVPMLAGIASYDPQQAEAFGRGAPGWVSSRSMPLRSRASATVSMPVSTAGTSRRRT